MGRQHVAVPAGRAGPVTGAAAYHGPAAGERAAGGGRPGGVARMVGIKDVARQAKVSVGTVSNVINRPETVAEDTRERVQAVITRLGYVRSESARQLRVGRSRIVALLVRDLADPFFAAVAAGAERAAREAGLRVMLCNSAQDPGEEAAHLGLFTEQRVRGVLVAPTDRTGRNIAGLRRHGIACVQVDHAVPAAEGCSVSVDDTAGGALAVRHLLDRGHEEILHIGGPMRLPQFRDRHAGALAALRAAGLPGERLRHIEAERREVAAGRDAGARLLGMSPRPAAVFCADDLLALGVLQALFAAGVRVPDDLALVGYGDTGSAAAAAVPLTSVRQPAVRLGRTAAELLIEETGERPGEHRHRRTVLQPELLVRDSSLTPRP